MSRQTSPKIAPATRDGRSSSASRFTLVGPACLSSSRLPQTRMPDDEKENSKASFGLPGSRAGLPDIGIGLSVAGVRAFQTTC
jgi:hypothetical protein